MVAFFALAVCAPLKPMINADVNNIAAVKMKAFFVFILELVERRLLLLSIIAVNYRNGLFSLKIRVILNKITI